MIDTRLEDWMSAMIDIKLKKMPIGICILKK